METLWAQLGLISHFSGVFYPNHSEQNPISSCERPWETFVTGVKKSGQILLGLHGRGMEGSSTHSWHSPVPGAFPIFAGGWIYTFRSVTMHIFYARLACLIAEMQQMLQNCKYVSMYATIHTYWTGIISMQGAFRIFNNHSELATSI